jgi:SAM-dependent methyltransferase/uncharacterized coiled-coil protein SlyX
MLEWTGERYLPYIDPSICGSEIHYEHLHRYAFASQFVNGKKVLDLASGEGYGTFILSQNAQSVVGVEIDPDTVSHAKKTYERENITFIEGSILNIPIVGEKLFDVIVCFEAIEHILEQDVLISEIKRLLKEKGLLILSTPNKKIYSDDPKYSNPFHKKELYLPEIEDLLSRSFTNQYIFGQRLILGSSIFPLNHQRQVICREFDIERKENHFSFCEEDLLKPVYFVIIASNSNLNELNQLKSILVDQSETRISILGSQIHHANNTIQLLNQHVSANELTIADLNSRLNDLILQIDERDNNITNLNSRLNDLILQVDERDNNITNLNSRLNDLILQVDERDKNSRDDKSYISELEQDISAMKSGIIWKFTTGFDKHIISKIFPENTRRKKTYELALNKTRLLINKEKMETVKDNKKNRLIHQNILLSKEIIKETLVPVKEPSLEKVYISSLFDSHQTKSQEYIPLSDDHIILSENDLKIVAFYLPQFHPIPENDIWWGKGFTEWTNVIKGIPHFIGHYQPHVPDELGYYDLRLIDIQKRQIELARQYGIFGFCFHYYWFNGKKLLEKPLNQFFKHKEIDFPFCICWANENWTRRWDGREKDILISQTYSAENDIKLIQELEHLIRDPRYIRINERPVILVYHVNHMPDPVSTVRKWREYSKNHGIGDLYLIAVQSFGFEDPREYEFDAAVEFPPHTMQSTDITNTITMMNPKFRGNIRDYEYFVKSKKYLDEVPYNLFKTISPGWDNTARRQNSALIYHNARPELYQEWLSDIATYTHNHQPQNQKIIFVNAWNEWAEGAHLEPDKKYGYAFLQATADVVRKYQKSDF